MLDPGIQAPDFTLPGTETETLNGENQISRYRLSDAVSSGPVVLTFYLFDFHPECTKDVCDIRDLQWLDLLETVSAFAISTDKVFSHREFAERHQLDYPLLSDSDGTVAEAYDVLLDEFADHRRISQRSVFVIDTDQIVRYSWMAERADDHPNWHAVHDAVRELL
ncbi:Peroxiredoxin [Halanaeroarchaeum sp. HSR-CO]|uniref:redoxin domain-containing protein n=1 Tax=Halanaeroarchaeum sp. HSR-CO TaxID=2866382 RepID=UPI00217E2935|nr:redoxin domain-containing protein [Halanaeroarchaeum sp. HSR-CO]UWG47861.1 Peroxiredoxin [Halanaeroarchaeum sp. HSR-CO]